MSTPATTPTSWVDFGAAKSVVQSRAETTPVTGRTIDQAPLLAPLTSTMAPEIACLARISCASSRLCAAAGAATIASSGARKAYLMVDPPTAARK